MGNEFEMTLTCRRCGKQFIFTQSEQEFYQQKGFTLPNHCQECRSIRRAQAPLICPKCGKKLDNASDWYCLSCLEIARLEIVLEARALKEALDEVSVKLSAAESEKVQILDTMNAKLTAMESENAQLTAQYSAKLSALEPENTKLLQEAEIKLSTTESEKAHIASLLEQQKQLATDLQEKFSHAGKELEKALKHRATLDYLEPTLNDIKATLAVLGRTQEGINQTLLQMVRFMSEKPQKTSLFEAFKRIFRINRKSASPVN